MKLAISLKLLILTTLYNEVNSLDILGIFPYQGKSHFFVFQPYLRELAKRGHNLTVISYFPQKEPTKNYKDISLADKTNIFEDVIEMEQNLFSLIKLNKMIADNCVENCRVLVEHEEVQDLVKSRTKFDLVLVEAFSSDCALGLAHQLETPVVGVTSHLLLPQHYDRFGVPHQFLQFDPTPDFVTRFIITMLLELFKLIGKWYRNQEQAILAKYFDDIPPLDELGQEVKLLLTYSHYSMYGPQAWPENIKEVGGYHVAKVKPLPDELREFIEESKHGVIYISFGSMLKSTTIPKYKLEAIIAALSELPQRVIWKWEENHLPGDPKNIYLSKWLPQNDILAHPNVVAFYSHCGLLGTTEAMHHGVPMVAMPVFADQPINAMAIERRGFGVQLLYGDLTKDALLEKLKTILHPEFRRRAKEISRQWHDRPMSPMESAIYWTEYAARHPNSTLRTAAVGMPHYQLAGWDVLFATLSLMLSFLYAMKYLIFGKRTKTKKD